MEERLWTAKDVQEYLGIGASTMYALLARGELLKPMKVGPIANRWDPEAFRQWVRERTEQAQQPEGATR